VRGGEVQRHARWGHGAAFLAGTPVDVARRFFGDGNDRLHLLLEDGPTAANRRALTGLMAAGAILVVEGGLRTVAACRALGGDGHKIQILEPAVLDDPDGMPALAELVPAPLLAVGDLTGNENMVPRMRQALGGCVCGIVLDLAYPVEAEGLRTVKGAVEGWDAELFLRGMSPADAGPMQTQLHPIVSLDLTTFVDAEFLVEMARFNRRARQPDWLATLDPAALANDRFLAETVRFIHSEMVRAGKTNY